jgi:hypothetical protein
LSDVVSGAGDAGPTDRATGVRGGGCRRTPVLGHTPSVSPFR